MVMAISYKEGAKINANTFELCIEVRLLPLFLFPLFLLQFLRFTLLCTLFSGSSHTQSQLLLFLLLLLDYWQAVLEKEQWREALLLIQGMERLSFKPSMQVCLCVCVLCVCICIYE